MIRSLYRTHDGRMRADLGPEEFAVALQDARGLLWVDLVDEPPEVCEPVLRETFGFHPLAIEDALQESHVPKINDWSQYLYLVLHAVVFDPQKGGRVDTVELDTFLGKNYVVTYQTRFLSAVDRVWSAYRREGHQLESGAGHLLYRLADELVADYMPAVEGIDDAIDQIEDQLFDNPQPHLLEQIFTLKRALLRLRRIITPQREVLNKLARGDYGVIAAKDRVFFRDVYDHLVRLYDISESLRDLVGGALETYLSVVNNRMNDVMKTLTVITTLFMPLSFVVGFFGMNFFQPVTSLDVWTDGLAFALTITGIIFTPVVMYLWMRRRAWL
jgi:magnesium transporter